MSVTLHTNLGDIKVEIFCESVPKTAEVCNYYYYSQAQTLSTDKF